MTPPAGPATLPGRGAHHTPKQLSTLLEVPTETLRKWRYRGEGPPYHRLNGLIRYNTADVAAWLAANRVTNT